MDSDGASTEKSTAPPGTGSRSFGRINPTQLILLVCVAAALGWAGFYGLGLLRSSAFNNDRAFRVLTEIVAQIENFQGTMTNMIAFIPESVEHACSAEKSSSDCDAVKKKYTTKLKLPDISVGDVVNGVDSVRNPNDAQLACKNWSPPASTSKRFDLRLNVDDPDHAFIVSGCSVAPKGGNTISQLKGKLRSSLTFFSSQEFFDQALLTVGDGTVLAAIPIASRRVDASLQAAPSSDLIVADASELLRIAVRTDVVVDSDRASLEKNPINPNAGATPDHPVVFEKTLGGEKYQVYVLPFRPSIPWTMTAATSSDTPNDKSIAAASKPLSLFVIGLKREEISQQIAYALWPDGAFIIGIFVLLAILSWPLVRVRFSAPLEPIPPAIVFASAIALILIPAALTVTSVWIWSRVELAYWADRSSEHYASQIETELADELHSDVELLELYQAHAYEGCEPGDATSAEGQRDKCAGDVFRKQLAEHRDKNPSEQQNEFQSWLPLRTIVALDKDGKNEGPRLSTFDAQGTIPQRRKLTLTDRDYFKALKRGDAWEPANPATGAPLSQRGFVAQRLFNRADAARVLQVAIPRLPTKPFSGIVSGDTRAYSLTAGVSPPLLRFAVVDRDTGTVVFHSKDERSLAENFFVETEQNPALRARLLQQNPNRPVDQDWLSNHFSGRYLGDAHRFYVRNIDGVPWSVVVFYSTKQLGAVAFEGSLAALATAIGFVVGMIALALLCSALFLIVHPIDWKIRDLAKLPWPRRERCKDYPTIAWSGVTLALLLLTAMSLSFGRYGIALGALLASAAAAGLAICFWKRRELCKYYSTLVWCGISIALFVLWTMALWFARHGIAIGIFLAAAGSAALAIRSWKRRANAGSAAGETKPEVCERHYICCLFIAAVILAGLPSLYISLRFYDLSLQTLLDSSMADAGRQIERRHRTMADDLARWEQDDVARAERYPEIWKLSDSLLHVPGTCVVESSDKASRWVFTALDGIPYASAGGPPAYDSYLQKIWTARAESGAPGRQPWRVRSIVPAPDQWRNCGATDGATQLMETFHVRAYQGQEIYLAAPYEISGTPAPDDFATVVRVALNIVLCVVTLLCITLFAVIIARKLCGSRTIFAVCKEKAARLLAKDEIPRYWYALSAADKVFLQELTHDHIVNPANPEALKRLARDGFIRFDPWPQIANDEIRAYVAAIDLSLEVKQEKRNREIGSWSWMRIPLMIAFVVVLGLFVWFAGSSMQLVTTIFAGIATLLGYLGKAQTFIRGKD